MKTIEITICVVCKVDDDAKLDNLNLYIPLTEMVLTSKNNKQVGTAIAYETTKVMEFEIVK